MSETQTLAKPKQNKKNSNNTPKPEYGYMYIGHLPHGFYEDEIKSYFSQFGRVCRVRLAHSKLTGNYKGYGFVQFESKEVAQIAADTMNNYMMFNKLLKCFVIPKEKLHPETFKNAKKKFFKPLRCVMRKKFNTKKSVAQLKKLSLRQSAKLKKKQQKLKELGINLDLTQILSKKTEEKKSKKEKPKPAEKKEVEEKKSQPKPVEKKPEQKVEKKVDQKSKVVEQKNVTKKSQPKQEAPKRKAEPVVQEKPAKQQKTVPTKEQVKPIQKKKNKK